VPFYAAVNTGDLADRTSVFASLVSSTGTAATAAALAEGVSQEAYRVESASALRATPDLERRLRASVARTMSRRIPGRIPCGVGHAALDNRGKRTNDDVCAGYGSERVVLARRTVLQRRDKVLSKI
jgi:hypothetical protein